MKRKIIISEEEKRQILNLHETQKKQINFFQILENKVNDLLTEQTKQKSFSGVGELPDLLPGEQRGEQGQITSTKIKDLKPYEVKLTAEFEPNVTRPYTPTREDLEKLNGLVRWLNSPGLVGQNIEVQVNAGSSRTGDFEDNKRLAIERGETGQEFIKNYLRSRISPELYEKVVANIPPPTDALANQGPKAGLYPNDSEEYKDYQKFEILAKVSGRREIQTSRQVKLEIYIPIEAPYSKGFVFPMPNKTRGLAEGLGITDEEKIQVLYNNWPYTSTTPQPSKGVGKNGMPVTKYIKDSNRITIPNTKTFGWVGFCVKGPVSFTSGNYLCSEGNNKGYKQVYAYNGGVYPGRRWLPYPSIDYKIQPETSAFFNNNPYLKDVFSKLCYISEGYDGEYPDFFKTIEESQFCQTKYSEWPNFIGKLSRKEVPGPESPWYNQISKTVWYKNGDSNGGLWTVPATSEETTTGTVE